MIKKIVFSLLIILSGLLWATKINAYDVPSYDGFINDYAEILSTEVEDQLETELQTIAEASDGAEIAVATINSLEGDTVENVAQEFFDTWQIGKKELDNGVLLLIAVNDRELRIHTGYGAESVITDAEAGRIIRNVITPEFKTNDYEAGVIQGVAALEQQFIDSPGFAPGINPINQDPDALSNFVSTFFSVTGLIFVAIVFIYLSSWLGRSKRWWPGGAIGFGLGLFINGLVAATFFGIFGLVLDYILSKNYKKLKKARRSTAWKNTWGGFKTSSSRSSWSSSSSSGGSSFGGGSSGGGGASGGW